MATTIRDVAQRAQVSAKTVSRVVNDEPGVSPATAQRVRAAMADLDYYPDRSARALRTGRTGTIGLAVPELGQPFFAELADRLTHAAAARAMSVVLGVTGERGEQEAAFLAQHTDLDGVILYWQGLTPTALDREAAHRPLVLLGENDHPGLDRVTMDNDAGIHLALAHLINLGRRRIAVLGTPEPGTPPHGAARARTAALESACQRLGTRIDPALLVPSVEWRRPDGAAAMQRLIDSGVPFDAVLAFNDGLALGALHALDRAGLRVPDDVAVTGFDNLEASRFALPSLTTVSPRLSAYATDAVDLLTRRLDDPAAPPRTVVEQVSLLMRDSTVAGGAAWQ